MKKNSLHHTISTISFHSSFTNSENSRDRLPDLYIHPFIEKKNGRKIAQINYKYLYFLAELQNYKESSTVNLLQLYKHNDHFIITSNYYNYIISKLIIRFAQD